MTALNRRQLLAGLLGGSAGIVAGCDARRPPAIAGEILSPTYSVGHRIREGFRPRPSADRWQETDVVIIGGGISGLAAGWRLARAGLTRFVILELEPVAGGTSRSAQSIVTRYPWGAHYVPVPLRDNRSLIALLREMEVIEGFDAAGSPIVKEQYLCRDPSERVFVDGLWQEGLFPSTGATARDLDELRQFRNEIARWAAWRDEKGRRAFAIPTSNGSDHPTVVALDSISMAEWVKQRGWSSRRLLWQIDYSCRDDYGTKIHQTSAWAGLFYFASRASEGAESQPLITWPEGNGRIVSHLAERLRDNLRCGLAATEITPSADAKSSRVEIAALDVPTETCVGYRARRAIFAAPQMLAPHLIRGLPEARRRAAAEFEYSPWLVANLHLKLRPHETSFPLCWDNVFYESPSLGYVTATHQAGIDYGPTVLTWYFACCEGPPKQSRQQLLDLTWNEAAEMVLRDIEPAHPEIRSLVERIDIMKWGHAMVRPTPGFVWSQSRRKAADPFGPIHFAGTDLSGIALCEEAIDHGVRAAEEVLHELGRPVASIL